MPLGAAALAGTAFAIDRDALARDLGFAAVTANSLDAVSDRDYVLEYLSAAAIAGMHLSRLAADLSLWATAEFAFVEFSDAWATGSSIMPQKKNADIAELGRGKTGRVYGNLMALLTTLKGLPFRDAHETVAHAVKAAMSHGVDLSELPLSVLQQFNPAIEKDVYDVLSLRGSLDTRNVLGGTAPSQVRAQIARHRARLA
jgi:argininosuccinate lyase